LARNQAATRPMINPIQDIDPSPCFALCAGARAL
jgi:hypothetical protein